MAHTQLGSLERCFLMLACLKKDTKADNWLETTGMLCENPVHADPVWCRQMCRWLQRMQSGHCNKPCPWGCPSPKPLSSWRMSSQPCCCLQLRRGGLHLSWQAVCLTWVTELHASEPQVTCTCNDMQACEPTLSMVLLQSGHTCLRLYPAVAGCMHSTIHLSDV